MKLFDLHSHNICGSPTTSIFNCKEYIGNRRISVGIHPWDIDNSWRELFSVIKEYAHKENVCAIGECGIDKLKSTATIEQQLEVFKAHALLAEEVNKPLIIHCVKGTDEIVALHKEIAPEQAWIIHGFRGKPQQAEQLTKNGFYISFGNRFNNDSLKATPLDKLFVESDDSNTAINEIYQNIATAKGHTIEDLALAVIKNAEKISIL